MAAAILRRRIAELGLEDQIAVSSAGVWAEDGHGASPNAIATLAGRGMDLTGHRSRLLTPALLGEADLVLVMEEAHRRSLFHLAPQHLSKVYLLTEMSGETCGRRRSLRRTGRRVRAHGGRAGEADRRGDADDLAAVGGACCVKRVT